MTSLFFRSLLHRSRPAPDTGEPVPEHPAKSPRRRAALALLILACVIVVAGAATAESPGTPPVPGSVFARQFPTAQPTPVVDLARARKAFEAGGELTYYEVIALRRDAEGNPPVFDKEFAAQLARCRLKESIGWLYYLDVEHAQDYKLMPGVKRVYLVMNDPYTTPPASVGDSLSEEGVMMLPSVPVTQTNSMKYGQRIAFSGDLALVDDIEAVKNARLRLLEDDPVLPAPSEADLQGLRVVLTRTVCYGFCPDYTLTIDELGAVTFEGYSHTRVKGKATETLTTPTLLEIVREVRKAGFFNLKDSYIVDGNDIPTYSLSVQLDGQSKTIKDYGPEPDRLDILQERIDQIVNSDQWIQCDSGPCR
ncbi:MAG: DUF6438 domain-containing protein [Chloroflexia bacterium]